MSSLSRAHVILMVIHGSSRAPFLGAREDSTSSYSVRTPLTNFYEYPPYLITVADASSVYRSAVALCWIAGIYMSFVLCSRYQIPHIAVGIFLAGRFSRVI